MMTIHKKTNMCDKLLSFNNLNFCKYLLIMADAARSDCRFLLIFTDSVVMIKVATISHWVICDTKLTETIWDNTLLTFSCKRFKT